MIKTLMYHKVQDFEKWKKAFDEFYEFRKSKGELSYSVGSLVSDPSTAYVINTWESLEKLKAFESSKGLKDAMKSAGVLEPPHTFIFNELDRG